MSSTQSFSLTFTKDGASSYLIASGSMTIANGTRAMTIALAASTREGDATLNDSAKNILFPNTTAHPIKMNLNAEYVSSGSSYRNYFDFYVSGTKVHHNEGSSTSVSEDIADSAVLNSTKSSDYHYYLHNNTAFAYASITTSVLTLYFTRYDFSATAGTGVTSASVSSSTGYDGDTITFSCQCSGTFDGWYNGSTRVSTSQTYTHTVNGADLALTAKASAPTTKTLSATYNGSQISTFPISVSGDATITYNGTTKGTVPFSGGTKTLSCGGKVASGNIGIGGKTLSCSGKLMATDIVCTIS